jgi:hypothetical protein
MRPKPHSFMISWNISEGNIFHNQISCTSHGLKFIAHMKEFNWISINPAALVKIDTSLMVPSASTIISLKMPHTHYYLLVHKLLKFNQNYRNFFRENRHLYYWGPSEGPPIFGAGMFIFTEPRPMKNKPLKYRILIKFVQPLRHQQELRL